MFRKKMLSFGIMAAISAMLFCGCGEKGGDSVNEVKNNDSDNVIYLTDNGEVNENDWLENSEDSSDTDDNEDFESYDVNSEFGQEMNNFAFDLYDELSSSDENLFFSPYSIISALSVLDNAATGETKTELESALYISEGLDERNKDMKYLAESFNAQDDQNSQEDIEDVLYGISKSKSTINTANSVWVSKDMEIEDTADEYFSTVEKYYGADVMQTDFKNSQTVDDINNWINDKTEGMIPRMISELSADTKMCLINAVYFKGEWTTVFEVEDTQESDFYGVNGTETVDMMYQYGNSYKYVEYDGLKGIRLPYGDGQVAMDVWIADEDESRDRNAVDIFNSMTNDARTELFESLDNAPSEEISELALPSFEVETETMNISDALKALGIDNAFDRYTADFDMVNPDLFVSDVLHKAKIKVDESGTEAAAATGIIMETCEAYDEPQEIYTFIADNPFIYVIRDVNTGTILFMGSYVE